ncbi:unnamed protein product, partial [Owenia fusiformis]
CDWDLHKTTLWGKIWAIIFNFAILKLCTASAKVIFEQNHTFFSSYKKRKSTIRKQLLVGHLKSEPQPANIMETDEVSGDGPDNSLQHTTDVQTKIMNEPCEDPVSVKAPVIMDNGQGDALTDSTGNNDGNLNTEVNGDSPEKSVEREENQSADSNLEPNEDINLEPSVELNQEPDENLNQELNEESNQESNIDPNTEFKEESNQEL